MAKVTRQEFSKSRPVLKPDDLGGATHAVLTIQETERIEIDEQPLIVMRFEEFPGHNWFPNVTSIGRLIIGFGDELNDWVNQKVPLIVVPTTNPTTNQPTKSLFVMKPEEWKKHIRAVTAKKSAHGKAKAK